MVDPSFYEVRNYKSTLWVCCTNGFPIQYERLEDTYFSAPLAEYLLVTLRRNNHQLSVKALDFNAFSQAVEGPLICYAFSMIYVHLKKLQSKSSKAPTITALRRKYEELMKRWETLHETKIESRTPNGVAVVRTTALILANIRTQLITEQARLDRAEEEEAEKEKNSTGTFTNAEKGKSEVVTATSHDTDEAEPVVPRKPDVTELTRFLTDSTELAKTIIRGAEEAKKSPAHTTPRHQQATTPRHQQATTPRHQQATTPRDPSMSSTRQQSCSAHRLETVSTPRHNAQRVYRTPSRSIESRSVEYRSTTPQHRVERVERVYRTPSRSVQYHSTPPRHRLERLERVYSTPRSTKSVVPERRYTTRRSTHHSNVRYAEDLDSEDDAFLDDEADEEYIPRSRNRHAQSLLFDSLRDDFGDGDDEIGHSRDLYDDYD